MNNYLLAYLYLLTYVLEFAADETFREKMRKFSFVFCKLFREIPHFKKNNGAKNAKTKQNFVKKIAKSSRKFFFVNFVRETTGAVAVFYLF